MRKRRRNAFLLCLAALLLAAVAAAGYTAVFILADDRRPPVISMTADAMEVSVTATDEELLAGVTAMDDRDGDVTGSILIQGLSNLTDDTVTVTYAAFDSAGNVSKALRILRYTDYQPPRFELLAPLVFNAGTSMDVLGRVEVTDLFDGNISNQVKAELVSNTSSLAYPGVHEVQFRVTNSLGDTAYLNLPVDVLPSGEYNAEVALVDDMIYISQGSTFTPRNYLKGMKLPMNVEILDDVANMTVHVESDVNTNTPGVYSARYTVSYVRGVTTYVGYTRLIVVVEG